MSPAPCILDVHVVLLFHFSNRGELFRLLPFAVPFGVLVAWVVFLFDEANQAVHRRFGDWKRSRRRIVVRVVLPVAFIIIIIFLLLAFILSIGIYCPFVILLFFTQTGVL
jgi:hypothetical protein